MRAGDEPRRFWTPSLGHVFGWKPSDMGDISFEEFAAANEFIGEMNEAQGG